MGGVSRGRIEQLRKELRVMRGQRHHVYRRASDGMKLVVGADTLADSFFRLLGGEPPSLSDKAQEFLSGVEVHGRMSDMEALPVLHARGEAKGATDEPS